jgi:hypothetical protein
MCITKDYSAQTEDAFWETLQTNSLVFYLFSLSLSFAFARSLSRSVCLSLSTPIGGTLQESSLVQDIGFRVRVSGLGYGVLGFGFWVWDLGSRD